jgi:hypothetical protein
MIQSDCLEQLFDDAARMQAAGRDIEAVVANPEVINLLSGLSRQQATKLDLRLVRGGYRLLGHAVWLDFGCPGVALLDREQAESYHAASALAAERCGARIDTPRSFFEGLAKP